MVPLDIVLHLVEREMSHAPKGYVLDGFPRNMEQALALEILLQERKESLDAAINLDLNEPEIHHRLPARGRPNDKPEIISKRIELYHGETDPVLRFYDKTGILISVSGQGPIEQVTERILSALQARSAVPGTAPTRFRVQL